MKKTILLLVCGMWFFTSIHAQIHLFLQEQNVKLKDGSSAAWVFPAARDLDEALDDLKDYCKDRSDVKLRNDGDNLVIAEKVSIPSIVTKGETL